MNITIWSALLTGLFTGGLSCLAVQGGLLASAIGNARTAEGTGGHHKAALPIAVFLFAKLIGYAVLGFLLGWFGEWISLSLSAQATLQILAAIFMIGTALNFLEVHPIFRHFVLRAPRFLERLAKKSTHLSASFAPAVLGLATIFLPCGVTQAMMASAISSGNPFTAALIMFFFVLGTVPLFFVLGYSATKLGEAMHRKFMRVAGVLILAIGVLTFYNGAALVDFSPSFGDGEYFDIKSEPLPDANLPVAPVNKGADPSKQVQQEQPGEPTIYITNNGYSPNQFILPANSKVRIQLVNKEGYSCAQAFTIPKLGVRKIVPPGETDYVEFQTPSSGQRIPFMCTMGMYRGEFVIR